MSIKVNCNDFADAVKDIMRMMESETQNSGTPGFQSSYFLDALNQFAEVAVCDDTVDMAQAFTQRKGIPPEVAEEIIRLVTECKDSVCKGEDREMTITCHTVKLFSDMSDMADSGLQKIIEDDDTCNKFREYFTKNNDKDILALLFENIPAAQKEEFLPVQQLVNNIPEKKLRQVRQLLGLILECRCGVYLSKANLNIPPSDDSGDDDSGDDDSGDVEKGSYTWIIVIGVVLLIIGIILVWVSNKTKKVAARDSVTSGNSSYSETSADR